MTGATVQTVFTIGDTVIFTKGIGFRRFGLSIPKGAQGKVVNTTSGVVIHPLVTGWKSHETVKFPMGVKPGCRLAA